MGGKWTLVGLGWEKNRLTCSIYIPGFQLFALGPKIFAKISQNMKVRFGNLNFGIFWSTSRDAKHIFQNRLKPWAQAGCFWHERSASGWSTAGNGVVVTTFIILLFFFFPVIFPRFSSVAAFSHRRSARIKKLILQKLAGAPKPMGRHLCRPYRPFGGPLAVIFECPFAARLVFSF